MMYLIDGPDFRGEIDGRHGFWLYTKPAKGHREVASLGVGETTVYVYSEHPRGSRYTVKRIA